MKHCDKCRVDVDTNLKYCPLCHQLLTGDKVEGKVERYPEFVPLRREILPITKRILMILSVVSIMTLLLINLMDYNGKLWSLIPIGSIFYFWMLVRYGILTKQNMAFRLAFLTTILIAILNFFDLNAGDNVYEGWAINYVTPFALLACNMAISVVILVKRLNYRDYLFYLIAIIVFSLVPLILAAFDVVTIHWPSIVSFTGAVLILLGINFLFPKSIRDEIRKRFHM
jgi:hypothetical protein